MPKEIDKPEYRTIKINPQKTLNEEQLKILIKTAKQTPIYLQILFASLLGLRKGEINGLKYSDIDYVHRTIHIQRQLGKVANTSNEKFKKKPITKQDIKPKTFSSNRILSIPDFLFEEILNERKKYEKYKNRRINDVHNPFRDLDYIVCSTYGNPRSKSFHYKYWKQLLKDCNLPDMRFHDLRASYCTFLLKNDFSPKAIVKQMGHATEIVTCDVYGNNEEIISNCVEELEAFINDVKPDKISTNYDYSDDIEISSTMNNIINDLMV